MKRSFLCSLLCHNGLIGGTVSVEAHAITYKTNKLTVDKRYRNLVLPRQEICRLSLKRVVFPIVTLQMTNGEQYRLLIFGKSRFEKACAEIGL